MVIDFQPLASPLLHRRDELLVNLFQHAQGVGLLIFRHGRERIHEALVRAGGQQPAADAQLVHQPRKTETFHQHPDGADQAGRIDVDVVCRSRHVVCARSAHLLADCIDGLVVFGAQAFDFGEDLAGLHRTAARAVDAQDHTLRLCIGERILQRRVDIVRAGLRIDGDLAIEFDQRGMRAGRRRTAEFGNQTAEQDQCHDAQRDKAEKDRPAPRAAFFRHDLQHQFFQHLALPGSGLRRRVGFVEGWFRRKGAHAEPRMDGMD
ncbi:hypothetical protein GALL_552600 [mine drainage metagenome]|uniref:Uncharacterized protein n=1 Tax=mine drainage metagenome TaxID=410659 RepID=A0A1J5NYA5_9ZZZZ